MPAGGALDVSVDVTNTGSLPGSAVVQLYVRDPESKLVRPEKELKGFAKLLLQPGETRTATLSLDREALAYYDDLAGCWVAEAGAFEALLGVDAADIRAAVPFRLAETERFGGAVRSKGYDISTPLGRLLDDPEAHAILAQHLPALVAAAALPQAGMARGFNLVMIRGFMPQLITDEALAAVGAELAKL